MLFTDWLSRWKTPRCGNLGEAQRGRGGPFGDDLGTAGIEASPVTDGRSNSAGIDAVALWMSFGTAPPTDRHVPQHRGLELEKFRQDWRGRGESGEYSPERGLLHLQEAFAAMADSISGLTIARLIDEHYTLVFRFAARLCGDVADAEDLTQQTFLTAQAKLDQLRDPGAARGWLCTIARHAYLRDRRQTQRTQPLWDDVEPWSEPSVPEEIPEAALQAALAELPEEFRTPVILFYFEGFSYKDIAQQLQVPIGTVMSRLSRAKMHLRERLTVDVDRGIDGRSPVGKPRS